MSVLGCRYVKTIGVLGGAGPYAPARTHTAIMAAAAGRGAHHDNEFPTVLCHSISTLNIGADGEPGTDTEAQLDAALQTLRAAGADIIGIACNSAHRSVAASSPDVIALPCAVAAAAAAATTGEKVAAVLAASSTITSGIHQRHLANVGVSSRIPPPAAQARIDAAIEFATRYGTCPNLADLVASLDTNLVILGCTELESSAVTGAAGRRETGSTAGGGAGDATMHVIDSVVVLAEALEAAARQPDVVPSAAPAHNSDETEVFT